MSATLILLIVLSLVAVVLGAWVVGIFNQLVTLKNRYKNAFAQIEVQLKRRYDLIHNLRTRVAPLRWRHEVARTAHFRTRGGR
jgi:LemA protein